MSGAAPPRHPKYRTRLCRNFATGGCPFGWKCNFLHPTPRINISSSSFIQYLSNWNSLLPQLLPLSTQQGTEKKMSGQSRLIDEDTSPSTSLLLSLSDGTSSGQAKRSSRRKKYPCRHFVRTGGWCPAGRQCKFYHDVAALPSPGVRRADCVSPLAIDPQGEGGRTISGGVLMGIQSPSPPIVSQTRLEPSQYIAADLMQSYQPIYCPDYTWQPYQPYYATVPFHATAPPSSVAQQIVFPPPQPQARTTLPLGSYEVNGTTYFPTFMPPVAAPPSGTYPISLHHSAPYNHPLAPAHPYYAPHTLSGDHHDIPNQITDITHPQTSFDPFASDPMVPGELPLIPRLEDYQISPIQRDTAMLPPSLLSVLEGDLTTNVGKPKAVQEDEFPYHPPKDQRVGHARRISVNVKKHGRANSG